MPTSSVVLIAVWLPRKGSNGNQFQGREKMPYCKNCGNKAYIKHMTVPFDYPNHEYGCGRLKHIVASDCCEAELTLRQPLLHCPVDGCKEEMVRVDDEWCECEAHGQLPIAEVRYMNNDQGLDPYKRRK